MINILKMYAYFFIFIHLTHVDVQLPVYTLLFSPLNVK